MGHRVSIYLTDELWDAWKATGVPLGELVRRGLEAGGPVTAAEMRGLLGEWLGPPAHATHGGTGTAEVPHSGPAAHTADSGTATHVPHSRPESGTTVGRTGTTLSGTASAGGVQTAPREAKATRRTQLRAEPSAVAAVISSVPDLPVPLTVASALPKPQRCNHPGKRVIGGFCDECDHRVLAGGAWA